LAEAYRAMGGAVSISFGNSDDQSLEIETATRLYDVIILGDPHALHRLVSKGLVLAPQPLARSPLSLAALQSEGDRLLDEQFHERLAIYDPDGDGIGIVSRDLLGQMGLWQGANSNLLLLSSATAMARALEAGEVRYALMLRADLKRLPGLREVGRIEGQDYLYLAALSRQRARPESQKFSEFIRSAVATDIISHHGYTPQNR
jgi:ABC-type molybdate transport system substrate-binding protein